MVEGISDNVGIFSPLSADEEQLILGGLLGDSGGEVGVKGARVLVTHRWQDYPYFKWKHDNINYSEVLSAGKITPTKKGPRFYIGTHEYLLPYYNMFYSQGSSHKVLDPRVLDALLPLGLAVWYMDDGSLDLHHGSGSMTLSLSSECFSLDENRIIRDYFRTKHDLSFNVQKHLDKRNDKVYHFLTLTKSAEVEQFLAVVRPYAVPCMRRKFGWPVWVKKK